MITNFCVLQFGYIVLTTSAGIMDHEKKECAREGSWVLLLGIPWDRV
jgi:ribosomal protein S8